MKNHNKPKSPNTNISDYGIANDMKLAIKHYSDIAIEEQVNIPRFLKRIIENHNNSIVILDIGCFIGSHLKILQENGFNNLHGFDIVFEPLIIAKNKGLKNILQANCEFLPYKSQSFDYCIVHNVIEHILNPSKLLSEINRILKHRGKVYITVPNARSLDDIILRLGGMILHGRSSHIQKFNLHKLVSILNASGFEISGIHEQKGPELDFAQLEKIPFFRYIRHFLSRCLKNQVQGWSFELYKLT
jgi:2-polyprenyl-3-methyl-5-hydroxy-6-metoxy-1,4-benzoquinol methylase